MHKVTLGDVVNFANECESQQTLENLIDHLIGIYRSKQDWVGDGQVVYIKDQIKSFGSDYGSSLPDREKKVDMSEIKIESFPVSSLPERDVKPLPLRSCSDSYNPNIPPPPKPPSPHDITLKWWWNK